MSKLTHAQALKKQGKRADARRLTQEFMQENIARQVRTEAREFLQILCMEEKDFDGAMRFADELVRDFPKEARFHNNRGIVLACAGKFVEAVLAFTKALECQADYADALLNLAKAWINLEQPAPAVTALQDLVRKKPFLAEPFEHLGNLYDKLGRKEDAQKCFRKSSWLKIKAAASKKASEMPAQIQVSYAPGQGFPAQVELMGFIEELLQFGQKSAKTGKWEDARGAYESVVELHAQAPVRKLGEVYAALGEVLERTRKGDKAVDCFRKAVDLEPKNGRYQYKFAEALGKAQKVQEACDFIHAKLAENPGRHDLREVLGKIYIAELNADGAEEIFSDLTARFPKVPDFQYMFQVVQTLRGNYPSALAAADRLLTMYPKEVQMRFNRALVNLGMGNFAEGWKEYENRKLQGKGEPKPAYKKRLPEWKGEDLAGKRLLILTEQGFGDIINFVRLAEAVKKRGAQVYLQAQFPPHDRLLPLLMSYPHLDAIYACGYLPENIDFCVDLVSMPGILGIDLTNIPAETPYLFADKVREESFRKMMENLGGFKIGIAWQGNPKHARDKVRSFPLEKFQPIAEIPGVHLIKLQKNVEEKNVKFHLVDMGEHLDRDGAFTDTAAIIRNLDLVISCDSAIAHVAGALGKPVWIALSQAPDWRWLTEREDSPWYPTMRLFRQKKLAEWDPVFANMTRVLREEILPLRFTGAVSVDVSLGELLDKITILEIKRERIKDEEKRKNVCFELEQLEKSRLTVPARPELAGLVAQLKETNEKLWDIEDAIRRCEKAHDFGPTFIELARSVYINNDRRAAVKRGINDIYHSKIVEEKSYAPR